MKSKLAWNIRLVIGAAMTLCLSPFTHAQGPLVPPAPPSPLFKTLEQVEPRRPISSLPFTINQPGSYYVTTNLVGPAGLHGITINADCVTIDLMGFELRGLAGSLSGILINGQFRAYIYNGCIRNWGQDGINGNAGGACILERLRVGNNARNGLAINSGSQIRQCVVSASGQVGILTSNGVEVDDCVSGSNGSHGIQVGTDSNVRRCLASGNAGSGITGSGINGLNISECNADNNLGGGIAGIGQTVVKDCFTRSNLLVGITAGDGSSVISCTANDNGTPAVLAAGINVGGGSTVRDCTTRNNTTNGITASFGCTVVNNSCRDNLGNNIQVDQECLVAQNACDDDQVNLGQSGIRVTSGNNRIENNTVTETIRGLWITGVGNEVRDNTVLRNSTNYVIVANNQLNIRLGQIPETIPWPAHVQLAGSLRGTSGQNGITIISDGVTIDLGDHSLVGVSGSLDGILVSGARTNITIRNGSLLAWGGDGVDANSAVASQLRDLNASRNGGAGLIVGEGSSVSSCNVRSNSLDGIRTTGGCRVVDCSASRNRQDGIETGTGSTISGSAAFDNGGGGINAAIACTVTASSAYSNTGLGIEAASGSVIQQCAVYNNSTNGISVDNGTLVSGCSIRVNGGHGIRAAASCRIEGNTITANTIDGVLVTGTGNRIDGNHTTGGQRGFNITGSDNLIVRNSAQAATVANYVIAAGNHSAALVVSPGVGFASTSPWINFSF